MLSKDVPPISCVCPTTASRAWCLPLAIRCWQRQTYRDSELVVVVDGDPRLRGGEHISSLVPLDDERVRYVYLQGERTLGEKYNACIEAAQHEWVALWADDDWHAPTRLEATAALINGEIDIVGADTMLVHDLHAHVTRRYVYPFQRGTYVISGTMAFARVLGLAYPFPPERRGSDDGFVGVLLQRRARVAWLQQPPYLYVQMCHGGNITNRRLPIEDPAWHDVDVDLGELMHGDLADYEKAFEATISAEG